MNKNTSVKAGERTQDREERLAKELHELLAASKDALSDYLMKADASMSDRAVKDWLCRDTPFNRLKAAIAKAEGAR